CVSAVCVFVFKRLVNTLLIAVKFTYTSHDMPQTCRGKVQVGNRVGVRDEWLPLVLVHVVTVLPLSRSDEGGPLLSPCDCSGTLALVHQSCLEHWLTASNSSHCELCQHHYSLERQPKPFSEWWCASSMQQQRRTLFGDVLCFLFITPLSSLSGWLCVQGAMDLYYTNAAEALGLMLLTVSLFTIYVFWSIVSVRYHLHLLRTWRTTDQRVRLKIPSSRCSEPEPNPQTVFRKNSEKNTNKETIV
uniref:RING-CH-type domain-containing protein n=1 Tax=Neogobius melanostomus TaxID=47308 RepID=A0A8C6S6A7_9GOBI